MNEKIGIYIHYPFCSAICPYCDFNTYIAKNIDEDLIFKTYKYEIDYFYEKIPQNQILTSIYFGGGTPSLMSARLINQIITYINYKFQFTSDIEITLEANPTSFEVNKFQDFKIAGINRLSLGIQSFSNKELSFLGRKHSADQGIFAIQNCAKIFENFTFDLIYGLPNQTINEWEKNLNKILTFNQNHISLYTLTIEEGTPFAQFIKQGRMKEKNNEEMGSFIEFTWDFMKNNNFEQYEVSNFAKNNKYSQHNLLYWNSNDYIGIGAGAHGRLFYKDKLRYSTKIANGIKKWLSNENSIIEECLSDSEQVSEIIISNLRIKNGINIKKIEQIFKIDIKKYLNLNNILKLQEENFVYYDEIQLNITSNGYKYLDYIIKKIYK